MKKILILLIASHLLSLFGGYYIKENCVFQSPIVWKGVEIDESKPDIAQVNEYMPSDSDNAFSVLEAEEVSTAAIKPIN